ncbi:MAG: SET domain-containing protein [Saprospiraceae bacterium]
MQQIQGIYISKGINGRGVFAGIEIQEGVLLNFVQISYLKKEVDAIHHTELHDYYFIWGEEDEQAAIALGYGSLYNHSYTPNADFILDLQRRPSIFFAIRKIKAVKKSPSIIMVC